MEMLWLPMEMLLFAAFAPGVERAADCNWDSAQDEPWKREVEKLHRLSSCQVLRDCLGIQQSRRLCPYFSPWNCKVSFDRAPGAHRDGDAGSRDAQRMSLGHGKGQELHVMTQQSKIWVKKSRAQPTCSAGKEKSGGKTCLKEKGEIPKVLKRLYMSEDLRLMRKEKLQNH